MRVILLVADKSDRVFTTKGRKQLGNHVIVLKYLLLVQLENLDQDLCSFVKERM